MDNKRVVLILGGSRSGKSELAEKMAKQMGEPVTYIATTVIGDEEMSLRVKAHRERRPPDWTTVEETHNLSQKIAGVGQRPGVILVDCLTAWLTNLLLDVDLPFPGASCIDKENYINSRVEELAAVAMDSRANVLLVANEVGMGLVPPYPLGRAFRDISGYANRYLAQVADDAYLVVAGLVLELKSLTKIQKQD